MEVIRNQEFLLLPAEELHKLLASDDVNVPDEETIFHALMMWVKYDMQRRCSDLSMLLAFIRLPLLPPQVICVLIFQYIQYGKKFCVISQHYKIVLIILQYSKKVTRGLYLD